ncbi:hypothetical protein [uncultured Tenacibaculum sp.]|uniref:hypothetical protein n=1 Tax=uncultured Tenacibaculum sp. TaxID=174713 RepID=UPI00262F27B8|nr:hypothetical protein [uncultured Tenacibaculum sp.]
MKIAILGWGSLIWQPKSLFYDKKFGWKEDGPKLPIEFSRISKNGRLTLVIDKEANLVQTLYTLSNHDKLDEAILNLAIREGSKQSAIGYYNKKNNTFTPNNFEFKESIKKWIILKEFDAVIWTNLGVKFKYEINNIKVNIKPTDRLEYLKDLNKSKSSLAEEYIRKTPSQIKTQWRKVFEENLDWLPIT